MNQEERNIILELDEALMETYRELAARIAKESLDAGFTKPWQERESAYNAQSQVASLGVLILERVIPALLDSSDINDVYEMVGILQRSLSRAATANGLPACDYYHPRLEGEPS